MTTQTGFRQDNLGSYIDKDPEATLVYSLDWTNWLEPGDLIANSQMTVSTITGDAAPVTISTQGVQINDNVTYVELSGGSTGNVYTVTNTITTANLSVDVRRFRLKVVQRYL